MVIIMKRIKVVIQNLKVFCNTLKKQVKLKIVKILPYFQEEMMVQEYVIRLEKKKNKEKKQIKICQLTYSRQKKNH